MPELGHLVKRSRSMRPPAPRRQGGGDWRSRLDAEGDGAVDAAAGTLVGHQSTTLRPGSSATPRTTPSRAARAACASSIHSLKMVRAFSAAPLAVCPAATARSSASGPPRRISSFPVGDDHVHPDELGLDRDLRPGLGSLRLRRSDAQHERRRQEPPQAHRPRVRHRFSPRIRSVARAPAARRTASPAVAGWGHDAPE